MFFRELSEQEAREFKKWARKNYKPYDDIKGLWHPLIQLECVRMNTENAKAIKED
jgi:hypothetical protein